MAIDPSVLSQVVWDDEPVEPAGQNPLEINITGGISESQLAAQQAQDAAQQPIDLSQVVWDDEPGAAAPAASNPANQSAFARMVSGQPEVPQVQEGNALGRALGEYGGRQVLQGAAGLYGSLGGDALNYYVLDPIDRAAGWGTQLGTGGQSYRDAAGQVADQMGMRRPQNSQERIISDIGEGLAGTALTMGIGGGINALANLGRSGAAPVTNRLADLLTAQPVQQAIATAASSGASSAVRESGGSKTAQVLTGLGAGLAPAALSTAGAATTRGLVRGSNGAQMQRTIDDFAALGATPSVGQASGNRAVQGVENLLAGAPTSTGVMSRFAERQADDIGEGLRGMGDKLSRNASAERAGREIERGVDTFDKNVAATRQALYWQADRFIPPTTATPMANTVQTLTDMTTPLPGAANTTGAMVNPWLSKIRANLEADLQAGGGQIPYEALRKIRTEVGQKMTDFSLTPDTSARELRGLYAALSRDMEAVASAQGPQATSAAKRANNYTRVSSERLEQIQRVIDKNGGPEKVYTAAMSGTQDGGTTLRAVMQALPPQSQKAVTAAVIKRMGMATPGAQNDAGDVFSAATFLTKWNNISPEARRALFDRYGAGFSQSMDQLARVADNIKQGGKVFANPSGTANRAAALTYGASLVASLFDPSLLSTGGLVAGGATANASARLLTNPKVVAALAQTTKMPKGAVVAQIQSMRRVAERTGDEDMAAAAAALELAHKESNQAEQR